MVQTLLLLLLLLLSSPQIPCDVQLGVKPISAKLKAGCEVFDIDPSTKIAIPAHAHIYATVTFRPTAMQVSKS